MTVKFRLRRSRLGHAAGTVCYLYTGPDYGLARDDERASGVPHRCATLDPEGGIPFFTVPSSDLERLVIPTEKKS